MTREERELSITYLEEMKDDYIEGEGYERHPLPEYYAIECAIKALEQKPKTGHWLDKKITIKGGHGLAYGRYGCSVCKKKQPSKTDFCPNCGADMREKQAESEEA